MQWLIDALLVVLKAIGFRAKLEQELIRCSTCGCLCGIKQIRAGKCAGHRVKKTGNVSFWEFIKILVGAVR